MEHWKNFWKEGEGYWKAVKGALNKPQVFHPTLIYHMSGLAVEAYFMAWTTYLGNPPQNHTFWDFVRSAKSMEGFPVEILNTLRWMTRFEDLCALIPGNPPTPDPKDSEIFVSLVEDLRTYLLSQSWPLGEGESA